MADSTQEAKRKHENLADLDVSWSVVGHLQTNKAKDVAAFADEFQALDRVRVAEALDRREEIGLRHTTKKNQTDGVDSPASHVPMSDMLALIVPVTLSVREFLAQEESDPAQLDAMQNAWFKAVTVTLVLWSRPYAGDLW